MSIRVAIHHRTSYRYDRPIGMGPQVIRLRPAPHSRTPLESYSLRVEPGGHFLNWQQDPFGNYLARTVFPEKIDRFDIEVDFVANVSTINPFDFFLEPEAEHYPFRYAPELQDDLRPYLAADSWGPLFSSLLDSIDRTPRKTVDFLVDLNQLVQRRIQYLIRMEPGVQPPEQTLELSSGSCRDSAWLLAQLLRHLGFATRFASGYLIQLMPDVKPLDGPAGTTFDFTDLHAWTEVYLPGAGWVGLDPTSGLLTGEGHIPVACTPHPSTAAPIAGAHEFCEVGFDFAMSIARVHEDPRVTKPYTEEQWESIESLGHRIDARLEASGVRLTMGGEPTFVSVDDMEGDEWQTAALGPTKRRLADELINRLRERFAAGGFLHYGQGKWYPGESLPRWAIRCYWRRDGRPLWRNPEWIADTEFDYGHTVADATRFARALADRLGVNRDHAIPGYEDAMYYAWRERRLPANVDPRDSKLEDAEERARIARVFEQGLTSPVGVALPLRFRWWDPEPRWESGAWVVRSEEMFLIPGDSPMGYRLPLASLLFDAAASGTGEFYEIDPLVAEDEQARLASLHGLSNGSAGLWQNRRAAARAARARLIRQYAYAGGDSYGAVPQTGDGSAGDSNGFDYHPYARNGSSSAESWTDGADVVRTALCVEPREGKLHVFMPPIDRSSVYFDLVRAVEETCSETGLQVLVEGYLPPYDPSIEHIKATPDPGVIEVNVHPACSWDELVDVTTGVYEEARLSRLGTEKFDLDGSHTGTGGGNHVVLGGAVPSDSPWLRRPDLLKSFLGFWHNHPSLSYLFSGKFIGPTSQSPRADESRIDSIYELGIALEQVAPGKWNPPWIVDRVFRHLLVDGTGNTHRSEFCVDKLFSPDSSSGRLGLVEFRAFEMPPHARMSLTQQLLLRALVAKFWEQPYTDNPVSWGTALYDRWMLPHFIWQDFEDVLESIAGAGMEIDKRWFEPHFEFRYPRIGVLTQRGVTIELRRASEPWHVLGEEPGAGYMARYVDSSLERIQVKATCLTDPRYVLTCNGRRVPLHPTGTPGEFVAGIRFRAWQPPSCLHPTIGIDAPLTFDLVDTWAGRSIGGCQYHVGHPGGLNPSVFPVNALEAESRRATRFFAFGHSPGSATIEAEPHNAFFPLTLDLRRGR
jgi:uncharacterized protein (DUF2126 family)/transglutaminase-like putative cysteine protease